MQRLLSGPWVPGGGVSGQALAVSPDGKLLFSGGHWDGSLRVTALPRGRLLSQLRCHLGTCCLGAQVMWVGAGLWSWPGRYAKFVIAFSFKEQVSFNFMATVTVRSNFGA